MRVVAALALFALSPAIAAAGDALPIRQVAPGIYAVVGDLGPQTYANDGINNNLGFVVTRDGVVVINSGPSLRAAKALHAAIAKTTTQPIKWVVNVNSQNHYWLGNAYFHSLGAKSIAHAEAARLMQEQGAAQLDANRKLLKDKAAGTAIALPTATFTDRYTLRLGDTVLELAHMGPAHTPGDIAVWLPSARVLYTGDIVYTERLLAIIPVSQTKSWVQAFDRLAALNPSVIVPGHGQPTDMARARRDTRDYLTHLRDQVQAALDSGTTLDEAVDKIDQSGFRRLGNFDLLARRNAHQTYIEMERDSFN